LRVSASASFSSRASTAIVALLRAFRAATGVSALARFEWPTACFYWLHSCVYWLHSRVRNLL
jgi:hypothetical protein